MTHTLLKNTPSAVSLWRYYRIVTALLALAHEAQAGTASINFSQSGSAQTWTVPAGVSSASVTLTGAKGGRGANDGAGVGGNGGNGGRVTGTLALTPGETLTAHVGAAGADGTFATSTGGGAGGAGGGGAYAGGRGGHAGSVGASGGGGGGGGAAALLRGATLLAVAGGAGGGGGAGGSTEWFFSDNQANRDGLTGYSGGYTTGNVGTNGADRGSGNDGGGGGGGGGGYSRGGQGGTLRKTGNNNTGGNGGSAGENYSSGLTSASASYIAVSGDASAALSFTLPSTIADSFGTAATVPYRVSTIDLTGSHALAFALGHAPVSGEVLTLVDNIGSSAVTGTFTGLPQGSLVSATYGGETYRFTLSYIGGTGNDITLSFVLPATLVGAFESASSVPYQAASVNLAAGYGLSFTLGHAPTPGEVLTLVDNTGASAVTGTFTGLPQGSTVTATYGGQTYRFTLSYTGGTGNDITLTRSAAIPPTTTIGQVSYTSPTSVLLNGTVNPNGFTTSSVVFEYGATSSYGTSVPVTLGTANGTTSQSVSLPLSGLALGIYHYRLTASSIEGSTSSYDGTFSIYEPSDGTPDAVYQNANGNKVAGIGSFADSAIAASGRWIGGGSYVTGYDGVPASCLLSLNPDGTPDTAFLANLGSGFTHQYGVSIRSVLVRSNGKILLGGQFSTLNGASLTRQLVCLNPDGTTDTAFTATLNALPFWFGFNDLVEQPDGKILGTSNGVVRRLNADGTVDTAFGGIGSVGAVICIALQPDGKILIGGMLGLQRLNADGTADTAFNTALGSNFSRDNGNVSVQTIAVAPDGGIWVGGNFPTFNNQSVPGLVRLNADGSLDSSALAAFSPVLAGNSYYYISDFLIQPDGKVVVGGSFLKVNNRYNYSKGLFRLNADGSLDTQFSARLGSGFGGGVSTLAVRPSGEMVIAGSFDGINGLPAKKIAQLAWSGSLSPDTQTVTGTYGSAIAPTSAFTTSKVSGTVSYTISPALPSGLSLDSSTGVISGTPRAVVTTPKTYTLTATGSTSGTATSTLTLSVAKAQLTITANNTSRAYGANNPSFGITITGLVNGDTASAVSGAPSYACAATTSSAPGSYVITPSLGTMSAANYSFPTFTAGSLTVEKAMQTLSIAPLATAVPIKDLSSVNLTATSSAGLPVTLSLDAGSAATLTGSVGSYALTDIGQTGTVTVRASQSGNANYSAAQDVVVSFDVTKSNQTITFAPVADKTYGDASFDLSASANSSLPVSFTLVSGPAALQGSTVTLTGAGTIVIRASQAGNDFYNEAAAQTCSFIVAPAAQTITFGSLAAVTYGDAPFALAATADSGLAVTYSIVSGPAALNGGNLVSNAAGTVVIRASQAGDDNHLTADPVERTLTVNRKALTVTGATAIDKTADTTTAAQIAGAQLAGVIDGDEVLLANSNAGSFSQATPGTNLPVTTSMTLEGADAGNYTLTQPALTATITAAEGTHTHQEDWRNIHFGTYTSEADAADDADPDHDGMSNLMEYALGQDPNASGVIGATLAKAAGNLEYTYTRSTGARENGAAYQIEWSDTLEAGSWSTQNVTEQIQGTQGALETVKATIPAGSGTKRFLRLQVVK